MRKARVAIVLPYFGQGGGEHMVSRLAAHLDLNEVEAEVICIYGKASHNALEQAVTNHGVHLHHVEKPLGFSLKAIRDLNRELDRFQPDIIHTHLSACVYCAFYVLTHPKVKMLHTIHNMPQHELIKPKRMLMSLMYRLDRAVPVAISREIRRLMPGTYRLCRKPELVYNPVDIERYAGQMKVEHEAFTLVHVGRFSPQKNHRLLIDAFEKLTKIDSSVELYLLGDGPLLESMQTYVKEKNLERSIHFEGNVANVEAYFAKADLFVLSSDYEGLPLVILEAMAASLPILSTDVGGVKDIVTDNGILVPAGSVDAFYQGLLEFYQKKEERLVMGRKSRRNVEPFDSSQIARQYGKLYRKYSQKGLRTP